MDKRTTAEPSKIGQLCKGLDESKKRSEWRICPNGLRLRIARAYRKLKAVVDRKDWWLEETKESTGRDRWNKERTKCEECKNEKSEEVGELW